ncbi:MAG: PAS domain-containing protein [Vicinamibacterales bacterium]|jgi:PAS domain S-box-containing protein
MRHDDIPAVAWPQSPDEMCQLLAEHATNLLSLHHADGRQVWATRSLEQLRGPLTTVFERSDPGELEACHGWWAQVLAGSANRLRWRTRAAAGSWRWLETTAILLRNRDRTYVLCDSRDFTDEKQAQDTVQESQRKLAAAARLAQLGYWEDDVVANLVSWSEECGHALGLPLTERWRTWNEFLHFVHADDRALVEECRARTVAGEPSARVAFRLVAPDGVIRYADTTAEPVRNKGGQVIRTVGVIQNVSERKRAEDVLRRSRERLRLALQATGLGPWDWDLTTNTVEFWPEWKRLIGYEPDEIPNRYEEWENRLHPDDRERVLTALRAFLDGHQLEYALEFRLRHKNGTYRWMYTRGVGLADATGRRTHMIGCHLDITDRKQLEEQYRQSQKMQAVGQLAGGVAHDFNNLLIVINGYTELVAQELGPSHRSQRGLDKILAAARSAANLTHQLLAFSRRQILQPQVLDLNEVLRRAHLLLARLLGEHITLEIHLAAAGRVSADPGQVEQVIMNLAVNARDAMPDGGRLVIATADVDLDEVYAAQHPGASAGRHVLIAVSDTGVGMDDATRARLFEPFFTTKAIGRGTGLGLATVYGIVKQSGGSIWVDSEPAKGSTFKIHLPVAEGEVDPPAPLIEAPALRGTETVLVVEDQAEVRFVIEETLRIHGYTVLAAANGSEAIAEARAHDGPIHLMLTDIVLSGENGRDIARRVLADRTSVRVLYMSGYTETAILKDGALEPGLAFIQKPFTSDVLLRRIRELLASDRPPLF